MNDEVSSGDVPPLGERAVIDALPRAVVVTDPNGRIVLWSAEAERLFGWSEHEVAGRSVLEVLAPPEALDANREDLAFVASGNAKTGDRVVVCRDGTAIRIHTTTRPVLDRDGAVLGIIGLSEEVTDLRIAEQQTRDLTEHFRAALEAGGLGTFRWNMSSGETVWDARLERLFGLEAGAFDGTFDMYVSLLHPDDRDTVLGTVRAAVEAKSSYRVEHKVVWPDGSVHWIAGAGGVTVDEAGVVTGTVGCSMDVTDRVEQEHERQRLAAAAVEAAERERLQLERLEFLSAINDSLRASSTVAELMRNVTQTAVPRLGDWCSIHVLPFANGAVPDVEIAHVDPAKVSYARELQVRFPYDPDAPTGVAHVIRTGATEFHPDITDEVVDELEVTDEIREIIAELALRSSIAVPLRKRNRILGALQFVMSSTSRRYTPDDVALAGTVADRIASSIENLRLYEQQRTIARTLQHSLLPAALPDIPSVEVAVRYWPAGEGNEVGGDFYDVFPLESSDCWGIVVGDVCGTGPAAAALTGLARHSIRDSAWHGDSPVEILRSLDRAVRKSGISSFLTAVYATLDTSGSSAQLTVASGGHPLPIHVGSDHTVNLIGTSGTLLGLVDHARFEARTAELDPGDVVVFYTDGATDVRAPHNLDTEQFVALVTEAVHGASSAADVAERMQGALEAVLTFARRNDDIALLVLRITGAGARDQGNRSRSLYT
jgi:PAS domain S-box-containing protein